MKKALFKILVFAGMAFAVSCQMEEPGAGMQSGKVDFSIKAGIPGEITTYASDEGGVNNVSNELYDQRFVLEVYEGPDYNQIAYRDVQTVEIGAKATFDVRLLAKKYKFALWADFVENGKTEDNLYNTSEGLAKVTISSDSDRAAGQEIADAYCYSEEMDLRKSGLSKNITLKRPFGKIRLVSTDAAENYNVPESVVVTYITDLKVPAGYNVLAGEAYGETPAGSYTFNPYQEAVYVGGTDRGTLYILGLDYIFASKSSTSVSFDVQVDGNGKRSVTNIPVSVNKLTTVIGNFYTNEGSIDVIVDDAFDGEDTEMLPTEVSVSTLGEAESALEAIAADPAAGSKDVVVTISQLPEAGDNGNTIEMPALGNNVTIILEEGISEEGLIIDDKLASGNPGNDFTGKLILKNNATSTQGKLTVNLPQGSCVLDGGSYTSVEVTTADNTFEVGVNAAISNFTVNKGSVKLYGTIGSITKSAGYNGIVYRCLSTQKSLENLLNDNVSGYETILIEVPADIDGGESKPILHKPVDVYADAKISNIAIDYRENAYSAMNIYDGAHSVILNNVKMSIANEYSICKLLGSDLSFKAVGCEFILTEGKSNQSGLNIQNGGTGNVISAELDGCYIGYYDYAQRVNKDMDTDYDYPSDFKWSSYSRGITTGNNSNKTYDGTATTNLTIKNSFIEGAYYAINTLHNVKLNVDIDNSVLDGRAGLNIWTTSERPSFFNVRNSKFVGRNGFSGPTEVFGTIVINGTNGNDPASFKTVRNINVVVDNSDIVSDNDPQTKTNMQYIADIRTEEVASCSVKFVNGTTLKEIKNPRLNYMVSMNYWNYDVVSADESVKLIGKEGVLLMPQKVWDGVRKTKPHTTSRWNIDGVSTEFYDVVEVSDLVWLAEKYNEGNDEVNGMSIMLYQDIDLNWHEWTPIEKFSNYFIGQEFAIRNLKITSDSLSDRAAGLIGILNKGTVLDLTVDGAVIDHVSASKTGSTTNGSAVVAGTIYPNGVVLGVTVRNARISGNRYLGGIAGYVYGSVQDCTAESMELIATPDNLTGNYDNGDKAGGIVGFSASDNHGEISGNSARNITITGYRDLGGIAGAARSDSMKSNSVENINITVDQLTNSYGPKDSNAGYVLGRNLGSGELDSSNTVAGENNTVEKK